MVHRSGSTHQYEELFANDESNSKTKDDLQIAETCKNTSRSNSASGQSEENETKRQLRTSKRLCSINPDVMIPPKSVEISTSSSINPTSSSSCSSSSSSSSSTYSNTKSSSSSNKTSTDTLLTFTTNLIPIAVKPKSIRNRRYTINDCVHPSEKSISVPFADQKKFKVSSTTDELSTKSKNCGKSLDDLNIKKDHFNCSVSLERLTGIADTISMKLSPNSDKDDAINKVLCLYCDRTFSSLKLYTKHVERLHQSKSGRRISARTINSNTNSSATVQNYPGCSYCNVGKVTCLESEELAQLIHHLIQQHGDKYFACEECLVRFQTRDLLKNHVSALHGYNDAKWKKESQRKTSRNVQSMTNSSLSSSSSSTSTTSTIPSSAVTPLTVQVDFDSTDLSDQTSLRNRLRRSTDLKAKSERSTRKQLMSNEETFLSRLGIGLNRSPRTRKGAKNRRGCSSEMFETSRSTRSNKNARQTIPNSNDLTESVKLVNSKAEPIVNAFDEGFYELVCQNVKQNLSCHVDGKLDSGPMSPSPLSPVENVPTVRSILVKSPLVTETEIHEATTISAFTAFPTLLTAQQHGGESTTPGKMKKPITKNSWKWKWDCVKKYKYVNEGGKIVKKIKQSTCGMRDLSTLDMWTQLTMRMRHEVASRQENEIAGEDNVMGIGEAAREEKRKLIEQLNKILDTRILPKINVEQSDQSIIKLEAVDESRSGDRHALIHLSHGSANDSQRDPEFPALMDLIKRERTDNAESTVILSGEWARPRCYICFGCGSLFSTVRSLEEHKTSKHPYVHSIHYEIVGKELIDGNLFRNFYIPSMVLQRHNENSKKLYFNAICNAEDSMDSVTSTSMSLTKSDSFDLDSSSRNSKVSVSSVASISDRSYSASADDENANSSSERQLTVNKTCSKCNRQCKGTLDLYRHMLDCSSDYAWILAKKRNNIKYRYFGVKRRKQQRSRSASGRKIARPKKERRNSDTSASPKSKEPSTPRQRPSDAESIQRMLANLPAKRAVRQIFPNLTLKPNNKNKKLLPNRKKILLKQKSKGNSRGFKVVSTSGTTINSVGTNLALRKRRNVETANSVVRRTRSSLQATSSAATKSKSNESGRKSTENPSNTVTASSSKNANNAKNKKINDLGSVFRRRTKAVVTKITNTFRRGQNQRVVRTATTSKPKPTSTTHHSPNTSKNTNSAKLDTNKLKAKSKKTFLRTLSFRRSNRNTKKMDNNNKSIENDKKPSTSENANQTLDNGKKSPKRSETSEKDSSVSTKSDESPKEIPNEAVPKPEVETNVEQSDPVSVDAVSKTPETPRLKRKRSIKTIINEMRAKCQNQTTATSQSNDLNPLDSFKEDKIQSSDTKIEIKSTDSVPSKVECLVSEMRPSTLITMPLTLTIEPLDEPLNLCISPQKNISAASSSKENDDKTTASTLQSPEPHLDNISPRRRTRKLNDCIAMLTGKLQEKLGVPFIDQTSTLLPILSPGSEKSQSKPPVEDISNTDKPVVEQQKKEETPGFTDSLNKQDEQKTTVDKSPEVIQIEKSSKIEQKPTESVNTGKSSELQMNVPENKANKEKSDETKIEKSQIEHISSASSSVDLIPPEKEEFSDGKRLRSRKTRDVAANLPKESDNKVEQHKDKNSAVEHIEAVVEHPEETKEVKEVVNNATPLLDSEPKTVIETQIEKISVESIEIDSEKVKKSKKGQSKIKSNKNLPNETTKTDLDNSQADSSQVSQAEHADIAVAIAEPAFSELPSKALDDVQSIAKTPASPKSKSKKKTGKQSSKVDKVKTVEPLTPNQNSKEDAVESLPTVCQAEKSFDVEIDIENEIKLNIVHKEPPMSASVTKSTKNAAKKKVTPKETPNRNGKSKGKTKTEDISETKVIPESSRTMRRRKQLIEEEKLAEKPPLEKKTPTEVTKSKETGAAKKKLAVKEVNKPKTSTSLTSEELKEVCDEAKVKQSEAKQSTGEELVNDQTIDEKPINDKVKKEKSINTKPSKLQPTIEKVTLDKVMIETTAKSTVENVDESPHKEHSPKKSNKKDNRSKKSKSKAEAASKEINNDDELKQLSEVVQVSQKSSELQANSAKEINEMDEVQIDKSPEKSSEKQVNDESSEKSKSNLKQSEKINVKTDKNSKQKMKKGKNAEKSSAKNSKESKETTNFDNSDDELLPWDPEKGFIQPATEKVIEVVAPAIPTNDSVQTPDKLESEKEATISAPKPKKKRKSELAQIIADQLLESFKEVDQTRVDELKKIQDLPYDHSEAELISTSLSTTPIPKRKSKKLFENIETKITKSEKNSAKSKDLRKKTTETDDTIDMDLKPVEMNKPKESKMEEKTEIPSSKPKKGMKDSKTKLPKKETKKKLNNQITSLIQSDDTKNFDNESVTDLLQTPLTDDINKKSLINSSAPNIQSNVVIDKVSEKNLFNESSSTAQSNEKIQNLQVPSLIASTISDTVSTDGSEKSKTNSIFAEVLLGQKNPKTERLSDIIGLADKEALSRVPSIKNVVFPQWQSSIDKPNLSVEKDKIALPKESKLNFWSRSSPSNASDKSDKPKIFGVVKNKARDLFSRISKKKLKKSIKTSIRSSSSSSSSSSTSSTSSTNTPKKPLLRPSILSCNNFRDIVSVKSSSETPPVASAPIAAPAASSSSMNDIFDSLRDSRQSDQQSKTTSKNISPPKLDIRRNSKKEKNRKPIDTNPTSPIETDTNFAKIAIALEKSNRKELREQVAQNLNNPVASNKTSSTIEIATKNTVITKVEQKSIVTTPSIDSSTSFLTSLQNDDSQDTIISQIVSKIREKADRTDSDDELCLADVAKGLPRHADCPLSVSPTTLIKPLDSKIQNDTSALVPDISENMEDSVKQVTNDENDELKVNEPNEDGSDDELDMEDNESVYTTFSQSTSITSGGGRKKRRKKSILSSGRKSKKSKERLFASPTVSHFCDICNKSFRNQNGLNNHKTTITHISKLSEQEFLNAKEKQNENKTVDDQAKEEKTKVLATKEEKVANNEKSTVIENSPAPVKIVVPPETHDNIQSSVIRSSPVKTNSTNCSPYVSPNHINSSGIEPISSPEQSSRFNGSNKNSLTPSSLNSRLTLSQEERLFYECCSMLKGSDRPTVGLNMPELITKPVTPKCNEPPSNIAHAAQSPRSHSSPRPGLPKLDINQFSDISSDSNPAYSCPQVPSSSKTQKVFSLERSSPQKPVESREKDAHSFGARKSNPSTDASGKAARSSSSSSYPHSSTIVRNYPDSYSDMGDSFPSSQDASESENYAQTILDRSSHFPDASLKVSHNTPQKGEGSHYMQASLPHENLDFRSFSNRSHLDSPLHSTSSQSSSLSRPRTKAALKGYENLKVSIPTTGLDMQHALERSPNSNGCKLAALADIALGNDVPFDLIEPRSSAANEKCSSKSAKSPQKSSESAKSPSKQSTLFVVSSDSPKMHSVDLKSKSFEATFHVSSKSRKRTQSIGKKTGYKDRKKRCRETGKLGNTKSSSKAANSSKPKDVYDFEESHDSVEDEIIPMTHTRPNKVDMESKSKSDTPKKQSDDPEDESSYSDRDDYYNFNSVSGSGTEDQENPVEEDENSDRETTQSSKSTKQTNNSQKKCLIMGRIFKNAKKNSETAPVEAKEKPATKPIPKKELDEIFDNLKNKKADAGKQAAAIDDRPKTPRTPKIEDVKNEPISNLIDEQLESIDATRTKSRKSREVANLEAEWGMSVEQIKGIIGVGMRKAQRRCTANRQSKLVETWSSDEYEEFHTTKDIIALIQEAEMKAQRSKARSAKQNAEAKHASVSAEKTDAGDSQAKNAKPPMDVKKEKSKDSRKVKPENIELEKSNDDGAESVKPKGKKTASDKFQSEDESDFDEHWNKKAKRAKIRNRRRTITSREDLIEKKVKTKSKEKSAKKQQIQPKKQDLESALPPAVVSEKKKHLKEIGNPKSMSKSSSHKTTKDGKPMPRRKRIASEMLYYWSSSSDDEFGRIEADSEIEDEDTSENHLEQHGWIVGDSHKKLVTLLAHAKGKKIEDCGVKESVHKRK